MKCKLCNAQVSNKKHGLCVAHEWERKHEGESYSQHLASKRKFFTLKKRLPRKVSTKRAVRLKEYAPLRDKYMSEHEYCEVIGCQNKAAELHHKKGRENDLLTDARYFMAICRDCHVRVDLEPEWAMSNGYSIRRF